MAFSLVLVFVSGLPRGRCFWSKQDVSRNRCEHEFAFNFDLSIQLPSMPFPVHQWMQGWFRLALKASSAAHVHGLAPAWKVKLGRNAKLGREVWILWYFEVWSAWMLREKWNMNVTSLSCSWCRTPCCEGNGDGHNFGSCQHDNEWNLMERLNQVAKFDV